jgi:hypothetical protein
MSGEKAFEGEINRADARAFGQYDEHSSGSLMNQANC